jgi:hypothetical protein
MSRISGCNYRWGVDWILNLLTERGTASNYSAIADFHTLQFTVTHTSVLSLHRRYVATAAVYRVTA